MSMKGFEPVTLSWGGQEFTVPAERQLQLIAQIEDALAGSSGQQAISILVSPSGPSFSRLSAAYGTALRFAGAEVSDDEIYLSIMQDFAEQKQDSAIKVRAAVMALLAIIAPPIAMSMSGSTSAKKKSRKKA